MRKEVNTVSSKLAEDTNQAAAHETVAGIAVLEQRSVIPPALIRTIHVEVGGVLGELKLNPFTFRVAFSVELGKHSLGLLALVVDEEPTGGLREEPDEDNDETWEDQLQPGGDEPGDVASEVHSSTR